MLSRPVSPTRQAQAVQAAAAGGDMQSLSGLANQASTVAAALLGAVTLEDSRQQQQAVLSS